MKRISTLIYFVICYLTSAGQVQIQEGDNCFVLGDYDCAVSKYNGVFINAIGKDRQFAEIKLLRAKWCAEHIKLANQSFSGKKYSIAIDEYLKVIETNPKDSFAQNQILKCRTILDLSKLRRLPNDDTIHSKSNPEINENSTLIRTGTNPKSKPDKPTIVLVKTVLPKNIKGRLHLCGIPTIKEQFQMESAILGTESNNWVIMENNIEVTRFKGNTFFLLPSKTTTYFLSPDNRPDLNVSFTVEVIILPSQKISIEGPSELCSGQPFTLALNGLSDEKKMKWQWYRAEAENSSYRKPIGAARTISDSLQTSFTYSVSAEYDGCALPELVLHRVNIYKAPSIPQPNYEFLNSKKDKIRLTVDNKTDLNNEYQWSKDKFSTIYANGDNIPNYRLKKGTNTFYVRYRDECEILSPMASISVIGKKRGYLFLNAGINGLNIPGNNSYNLTFGTKSWYIRGKTSLPFILSNKFHTSLGSTSLQISDQSRVTNYPRSSGTYYIVNGNAAQSRVSATTGFLLGTPFIRFYLGGGYGKADILWGLDIHNYSGSNKEREVWAMNTDQSATGAEVEGGVFIKLGVINIMGGASMIQDSKIAKPSREFQLGIGYTIK